MKKLNVLNVCGGNIEPLKDLFSTKTVCNILNVDRCYFDRQEVQDIEKQLLGEEKNFYSTIYDDFLKYNNFYLNHDIFDFLERTVIKFDVITIYRFLEHVSFTNILYFIYLLSRIINKDGTVDVIVPDFKKLAKMLLSERIDQDFERNNILLTTELLNEPSNPHASIWTMTRLQHFFELEGRFKTFLVENNFLFDGRDIYLRGQFVRI